MTDTDIDETDDYYNIAINKGTKMNVSEQNINEKGNTNEHKIEKNKNRTT